MKRNLLIGLCLLLAANIGAQPPIQSKPAKESTLVRGMSFVAIDAWLFDNPAIVKPAYSGGIPLAGLRWGYCLFEFLVESLPVNGDMLLGLTSERIVVHVHLHLGNLHR